MTKKQTPPAKPVTPQQALNNFKLFLELSSRNSYKGYREAVCEIANTVLELGIEGDDAHPPIISNGTKSAAKDKFQV